MKVFILFTLCACFVISIKVYHQSRVKKAYHRCLKRAADYQLTCKQATIADIFVIRRLAVAVWPRTYESILSPQQVIYMLNQNFSRSSLLNQMHAGNQFHIYFCNGQPVGFSSFGEIRSHIFQIDKLYILTEYQHLGIGRFAIQQIIKEVIEAKGTTLTLHVNRHNSARAFYEKMGFRITFWEDISIGNGFVRKDYLMELPIK
jgi:ribosomal protein S18 acetylase RimI-like enzyme